MLCKICTNHAILFDTVDFSKSCTEQSGTILPESYELVKYYRCNYCNFIFTPHFDTFTAHEFIEKIYNQDYVQFDPLYPEIRPKTNARFLQSIVDDCYFSQKPLTILDYGAGNGRLSEILKNSFCVYNFDPLNPSFNNLPDIAFDLIFSSEVVEHTPYPHQIVKDWNSLLKPGGAIIFSTMLQPHDLTDASWWYISPRNGHISIYSHDSLDALCDANGLKYQTLNGEWHVAFHKNQTIELNIEQLKKIVGDLPIGFIAI
jgi:2-polyprenyl-6-hydroxyphenyl methylase/3-demethylubiquinone-9 3-methyltransferase